MSVDHREYGHGTWLSIAYPWGVFRAGGAMCSDGKVRTLKRVADTADTFFSVPAAVAVNGRTVSGYITSETAAGFSTETDDDPTVIKFIAYAYGKNADALPEGKWKS